MCHGPSGLIFQVDIAIIVGFFIPYISTYIPSLIYFYTTYIFLHTYNIYIYISTYILQVKRPDGAWLRMPGVRDSDAEASASTGINRVFLTFNIFYMIILVDIQHDKTWQNMSKHDKTSQNFTKLVMMLVYVHWTYNY